jgi:ubiquinone/menaquinone biosynthesis C-methylase UbiE
MNIDDLQAYHKHITDTYDERSGNHEKSKWHRKTALRLVEELPPRAGDSVLDIGTGTGTIAFYAAPLVGPTGKVIAVDLSKGMLAEAEKKLAASGLDNLEFMLADAEHLGFSDNSFDRIYCASAFFCVLEPLVTLRHWFELLKTGGGLGFHALPETSYFWVSVARDVLANYGFPYLLNTPTGSIEKTRQLLSKAGFGDIDIREQNTGYYIPLEKAKQSWIQKDDFAPGQYPHPIRDVPPEILTQCQRDYEARIEELNTDKGVWNDVSMYYVYARK